MDGMAEEENEKEKRNDPGLLVYYNFTVGLQKAGRPHTRSNVPESACAAQGMPAPHCSTCRTGHASDTLQYAPHRSCQLHTAIRAIRAWQLHTAVRAAQGMPATHYSTRRTGHASYTL
jgi:hypothetical protein